jgi:hypothetical protein
VSFEKWLTVLRMDVGRRGGLQPNSGLLTLPLVQEPFGDAPQLPDRLSPFCLQPSAREDSGSGAPGDGNDGAGVDGEPNWSGYGGSAPVQNLDLSGTALDHVPTHFFGRLGIPTVSQFSARALKPRTNVGASIGANETGDRTSTGGGVGAGGFQSVGFDAFYSLATAGVPAIDFGVGSTTSTTCETYARAGRSHARGSLVVRTGSGHLRFDLRLLLFVSQLLLSCFDGLLDPT